MLIPLFYNRSSPNWDLFPERKLEKKKSKPKKTNKQTKKPKKKPKKKTKKKKKKQFYINFDNIHA